MQQPNQVAELTGARRPSFRTAESRLPVERGRRALLVVTSHGLLGNVGNQEELSRRGIPDERIRTGFWWFEAAHLYAALKSLNFVVEIGSPKGGKAPVNPISLAGRFMDDLSQRMLVDEEFTWLLDHTIDLQSAAIREPYDAVVLCGGHGALVDFPGNQALIQVLQKCYEGHPWGIIAANGHGVAGLLEVRVRTGKGLEHLVSMKNVACFNEDEEEKTGLRQWLPYSLEGLLSLRNAFVVKGAVCRPHVEEAFDGRLITGQNGASAEALGRAVVRAVLGRWSSGMRRLHPLDSEGRILR